MGVITLGRNIAWKRIGLEQNEEGAPLTLGAQSKPFAALGYLRAFTRGTRCYPRIKPFHKKVQRERGMTRNNDGLRDTRHVRTQAIHARHRSTGSVERRKPQPIDRHFCQPGM